jgi:serine O-acetyltransferase
VSLRHEVLAEAVEGLHRGSSGVLCGGARSLQRAAMPSREEVARMMADLRALLFPWHFGAADLSEEGLSYALGSTLHRVLTTLERQIRVAWSFQRDGNPGAAADERVTEITNAFAARLPAVQDLLASDALAAFAGDPAATSPDEAVFCYPGMTAIVHHRIAHELHLFGVPLIPRIVSYLAHASTGIDIHPGARIGAGFFIDHGTGVVIGETAVVGDGVRLYQGVTLGARSFPVDANGHPIKGIPRHPIVEDGVIIYAGATVLGRITIGRDSVIGGNVWLTHSVPPGTQVSQAQSQQQAFDGGDGI